MKEFNAKNLMKTFKPISLYGVLAPENQQIAYKEECKKLDAIISAIEGKSTARTISAKDVAEHLAKIEKKLNIPKKAMEGIKVVINCNSQSFPSAYKYEPLCTLFCAELRNGSWRILDIYRGRCGEIAYKTELTQESKEAILRNYAEMSRW